MKIATSPIRDTRGQVLLYVVQHIFSFFLLFFFICWMQILSHSTITSGCKISLFSVLTFFRSFFFWLPSSDSTSLPFLFLECLSEDSSKLVESRSLLFFFFFLLNGGSSVSTTPPSAVPFSASSCSRWSGEECFFLFSFLTPRSEGPFSQHLSPWSLLSDFEDFFLFFFDLQSASTVSTTFSSSKWRTWFLVPNPALTKFE